MGLEKGKSVATPGVKEKGVTVDKALTPTESTLYRSMAMRINYLAQDRPDMQYAGKELACGMSAPAEAHWQKLKRLGRYLIDKPRVVLRYEPQHGVTFIDSTADTDLAGCKSARKSTNGGALTLGRHCLKHWSTTQAVDALSSVEAEFYGAAKGASALLGCVSFGKDLGLPMKGRIHTNITAAMGMVIRRGLGKTRHINANCLWVQVRLHASGFTAHKGGTDDNVGYLFTKCLNRCS